jgi:hypothetical protein
VNYEGEAYLSCKWDTRDRFLIEKAMFKSGGYKTHGKDTYGNGKVYHFKEAMKALLPHIKWHAWVQLEVDCFINYNEIGIVGPASSGKTYIIAACVYTYIQIYPKDTSVIMSTTTVQALQLRIWGSVKEIHNEAKRVRPRLPGTVMESRCSLAFEHVTDEARDFRDGIIGVACRVGGQWVGISGYVGLKNHRIILVADEAHLMERGFLNSLANLRHGSMVEPFKLIAMGNPKDTSDALGTVCEPRVEDGGWEAYTGEERTRTWPTRAQGGIAIQLCGYDTPNGDATKGNEPFPGIILKENIESAANYYGRESVEFTMMNLGIFPQNSIHKRVVTVTLCETHLAFEEPIWESKHTLKRAVGIDAAYSGVGGDRCVLTDLTWGKNTDGDTIIAFTSQPIIIPVNPKLKEQPEDQIARFIKDYCEKENISQGSVGTDSTGKGALVAALGRVWGPDVHPIEFGGKPTERIVQQKDNKRACDAYGKFVTELWFAARSCVVGKQIRKMPIDVAREAATRAWDYVKGMKQDVEPKEETKKRLGRSPDLFDSFVVALEVARRNGFEIANTQAVGVRVKTRRSNWLMRAVEKAKQAKHELVYQ